MACWMVLPKPGGLAARVKPPNIAEDFLQDVGFTAECFGFVAIWGEGNIIILAFVDHLSHPALVVKHNLDHALVFRCGPGEA
jgi:hypothetical protein